MASIGLLHSDRAFDTGLLGARLQDALRTRVVVEQAAGVVAERQGVSPAEASDLLHQTAQREGRRLRVVAQELVDDTARSGTRAVEPGPAARHDDRPRGPRPTR